MKSVTGYAKEFLFLLGKMDNFANTHTHTHTSRRLIFARNILIYKRFAKQISSFLCDLSCTYLSYSKVIDWFPAILQSYFYPRIIFKT